MVAGAMLKTTDLNVNAWGNDGIRRWPRPWAIDDAIIRHHRPSVALAIRRRRPSSWMAVVVIVIIYGK